MSRTPKLAYGKPQYMVDAEPVRAYIRSLPVGWKKVAQMAGLHPGTVEHILYGSREYDPSDRVHADIAARIMAVTVTIDTAPDLARIDSASTKLRLQATVARGYMPKYITERLGQSIHQFRRIMDSTLVEARTARLVRDLWMELAFRQPPARTPKEREHRSKALAMAKRAGWSPVFVDPDDVADGPLEKDTEPDEIVVELLMSGHWVRSRYVDKMEATRRLMARGYNSGYISERTRWNSASVQRAMQKIRAEQAEETENAA